MALIVITVQDLPDGNVEVKMHAEPPVQGGETEFTDAQRMGAVALNAIHGAISEEARKAPPKLIIASADDLPR